MGRGGPSADKNKKTAEAQTRTVMGRHFTREGDAWVDVAYDPSRATVRFNRGSDQFRALVADEPGIRTIAEQLNGVAPFSRRQPARAWSNRGSGRGLRERRDGRADGDRPRWRGSNRAG